MDPGSESEKKSEKISRSEVLDVLLGAGGSCSLKALH
jgi:hypothetical protein